MQPVSFRQWVKARQNPLAYTIYRVAIAARYFSMPVIPFVHSALYRMHIGLRDLYGYITRVFWYTPLFQTRLRVPAKELHLYGGMPLVLGNPRITIGKGCRVSGQITITGRTSGLEIPHLTIGDNVDLGWNSTLAVGRKIVIGNNVRIAGRAFFAGYPGHPIDAADRAAGKPDTDDQVGDIIVEDDVWLATGVTISAGVTIGRGSIIAAGSVVTKDLPPFVLAAGAPAMVKRKLVPAGTLIEPV